MSLYQAFSFCTNSQVRAWYILYSLLLQREGRQARKKKIWSIKNQLCKILSKIYILLYGAKKIIKVCKDFRLWFFLKADNIFYIDRTSYLEKTSQTYLVISFVQMCLISKKSILIVKLGNISFIAAFEILEECAQLNKSLRKWIYNFVLQTISTLTEINDHFSTCYPSS